MGNTAHKHSGDSVLRGRWLKQRIEELGWDIAKCSEELKYSDGFIEDWMKGTKNRLSDKNIEKIHNKLGVSKDYFDKPWPEPEKLDKVEVSLSSVFTEQQMQECNVHQLLLHDLGNMEKYSAEVLHEISREYHNEIKKLCLVASCNSQIILYTYNVKMSSSGIYWKQYFQTHPSELRRKKLSNPLVIGMKEILERESQDSYWTNEFDHLNSQFDNYIEPRLRANKTTNICVFALAPQPLIVELGRLLACFPYVEIYQPHREKLSWEWSELNEATIYISPEPESEKGAIVLNLSLSTTIERSKIENILGGELSIWTITIEKPDNDFLRSRKQLNDFKTSFRDVLDKIVSKHGQKNVLHVFLSVPIAIAFEIGRLWSPGTDPEMNLYGISRKTEDYSLIHTFSNNKTVDFVR